MTEHAPVILDIAGTSWSTETRGADVPGGTGYGVRLLVELLKQV